MRWWRTGCSAEVVTVRARRAWSIPVIALADVGAAGAAAILVFRMFGPLSGVDTNPPVCYNAAGYIVSCSLTPAKLMLPTFVGVLLILAIYQVIRRRRAARSRPTMTSG